MTIDIEKLAEKIHENCMYGASVLDIQDILQAYAAKVLEDKKLEIAELNEKFKCYKDESLAEIVSLNKACYEYKSHINDLREALEVCKYDCHTGEVIGIAQQALSKTPEQSLKSVINETIERCAITCELWDGLRYNGAGEIIRELKGKQDGT